MTHDEPADPGRAPDDHARLDTWPPGWDEFTDVRSRFLAHLARDAEVRRLERAMRLPAPSGHGEHARGTTR